MSLDIKFDSSFQARRRRGDKEVAKAAVCSVEAGISRKVISEQYGVTVGTIAEWMRLFGSPDYHNHKRGSFTDQLKRSVVRAITEGRLTIKEAALANRTQANTVRSWIRAIKKENTELAVLNRSVMAQEPSASSSQDLKALEQRLQEAQLKIAALETLIEIAEKQYKIEIRKKPGAKQSPK